MMQAICTSGRDSHTIVDFDWRHMAWGQETLALNPSGHLIDCQCTRYHGNDRCSVRSDSCMQNPLDVHLWHSTAVR